MTRLSALWERIRGTYWAVPSAMAAASIAMSFATIEVDRGMTSTLTRLTWVYSGGPEGARAMLSTIAASMITVAGVTFSITIVALTLASQQFGPRLLRNFLRDLGNQITLGTFIATFLYCLLILRTVRGNDDAQFVPHFAVTIGVIAALLSIGVLIFFIHHVATSIQANQVIATVAADLEAAVARLFPDQLDQTSTVPDAAAAPMPSFDRADAVLATRAGYVQVIDEKQLLHVAQDRDLILRIDRAPGTFVRTGSVLMSVSGAGRAAAEVSARLAGAFVVGAERGGTQDLAFFVNQLVELAVRALSSGINDPATACACIDRLEAALSGLAGRRPPPALHCDAHGRLRLITQPARFPALLESAMAEIARYGRSSVSVSCRLLDALGELAGAVRTEEDRHAVLGQLTSIGDAVLASTAAASDRRIIEAHYDAAIAALQIALARSRSLATTAAARGTSLAAASSPATTDDSDLNGDKEIGT
jgi:uncharacterized membrane protein